MRNATTDSSPGGRERTPFDAKLARRHERVKRFRGVDNMHARKTRPEPSAHALESEYRARNALEAQRRKVERGVPMFRHKHRFAEHAIELAAVEGPSARKGRALDLRP